MYQLMAKSRNKYPFYEGNFTYIDFDNSNIARRLKKSRVGWGGRAIEMRANKTRFDRFDNDTIGLNEVFKKYRVVEALNKLKDDTLVCGVSFIALAGDRAMPFTALEATGTYDWYTQNLKDGVAVFQETTKKNIPPIAEPDSYMYFTRDRTVTYMNGEETEVKNSTGRPLIALLTHKSTTKRPFGRSVLTTPARDALINGSQINRQAMIAGYHYNSKVNIVLGVDNETAVDTIQMSSGDTLKIGTNENGQIPQIGEFAQHAMAPFKDNLLLAAQSFCAETKLSLNNLSLGGNAPDSPEALEIVGDDLRDDILDWQAEIGEQLKYFAVTLYMHDKNLTSIDQNLQEKIDSITASWLPIFRGDVSKFGDGLTKIAQNAPGIVQQRSVWRNLGLSSSEIDAVIASATAETEL